VCVELSASVSHGKLRPTDVTTRATLLIRSRSPDGTLPRCICPTSGTMRTVLLLGRQCLRRGLPNLTARISTRQFANASSIRRQFATPRFGGRTLLWSGAATGIAGGAVLSPLAFVEAAEDKSKSSNGEKTHEEAMLEVSRRELDEQVPKALENSAKYRRGIYFFVEDYIIEPIATGLRFLHLVIIFVPVIVTIPAIWLGARQPNRDNERTGTLWWYGFLVGSMERAGAAFIKVRVTDARPLHRARTNLCTAGTVGCFTNRRLSYRDVFHHVNPTLQRPCAHI
jgi:aarF domain-containing kinase